MAYRKISIRDHKLCNPSTSEELKEGDLIVIKINSEEDRGRMWQLAVHGDVYRRKDVTP